MNKFKNAQRIMVVQGLLEGEAGTVWRLRYCDNQAWVRMDNEPPEELRSFPQTDSRGNNVLLSPEQCTQVIGKKVEK